MARKQPNSQSQQDIYGPVYRVRDFMALLQNLSLLPTPQLAMQAAAALTSNYLTMNTYELEETSQKLRIEESQDAGPSPQGTTKSTAGAPSAEAEPGVPHEGGAGSKGEGMSGGAAAAAGAAAAGGPGTGPGAEGTPQRKDKSGEERHQAKGGIASGKAESGEGGRGSASSTSDASKAAGKTGGKAATKAGSGQQDGQHDGQQDGRQDWQRGSNSSNSDSSKAASKAGSEAGRRAGAEAQMDQPINTAHQELSDADVREVLCWLDAPLTYPDFLEGVARVANALLAWQHDNLKDRLNKFLTGTDGLKVALKVKIMKRDPQHREGHREQ
ncbi:hypothetical protein DUNSADRAFT_15226 [Dunaliella salina]|uniref:Uncharacterized protein n=1 Tax=Dunaliella salina TaxID=3046 RepID=A0ABQ7H1X6_DUNSA|nr:hypothetical protein DUNSADRAFT_15226 [Dunaliella salina]|eukprot:KAF5840859.1 hypothetical protein DUNSADRAFT_15226 [Dunaliella salina]